MLTNYEIPPSLNYQATVICDIFMLYMSSGKEMYKDKKFQFVTDIKQVEDEQV
jgi:hypothetical protein